MTCTIEKGEILIVDDERKMCTLQARWLTEYGYKCQIATSSDEALQILECDPAFTLLIADIRMKGMDGIELLRRVKEKYIDLAVLMVTAVDDHKTAETAISLGAYGYIIKPFERNEILVNVINALRRRELEIKNKTTQDNLERLVANRTKELEQAYENLKSSQNQIIQQEKLASIGQLAAGVAHEINNPTGYISSNLLSLRKYADKLAEFIQAQADVVDLVADERVEQLRSFRKTLKIDFLIEDIQDVISESLEGTNRIKTIVQGLKNFSRSDQNESSVIDVNECIETTLAIIWNELKYKATLDKDYGELRATTGYPQQLSQVFMNILVNAAHAIENQGVIGIKTRQVNNNIIITISDTGCGIPPGNISKIFEPFFTTKEMGKGTGLGMSIAKEIIKKHGGEIKIESTVGEGTTFVIKLPCQESGEIG